MKRTIVLNEEEARELDALLRRELADSKTELRRTRNVRFREQVRHHMHVAEHLLEALHQPN